MNKLYIQKDSKDGVNNFLYFNDHAILILDNFIKTSVPGIQHTSEYFSWINSEVPVNKVRVLTPDMMESVYNFISLMEWEFIVVSNDIAWSDKFITSCKEL